MGAPKEKALSSVGTARLCDMAVSLRGEGTGAGWNLGLGSAQGPWHLQPPTSAASRADQNPELTPLERKQKEMVWLSYKFSCFFGYLSAFFHYFKKGEYIISIISGQIIHKVL